MNMRVIWSAFCLICIAVLTGCGDSKPNQPATQPNSYVFVANSADSTISAFTRNKTTGALSPVAGSPFTASPGVTPTALALLSNASHTFLVVSNQDSYNTGVFAVNRNSGALTQAPGSPFAGLGGMRGGLAVHPSGGFVYVAADNVGLIGLAVNSTTGAATIIPGSPFGGVKNASPVIDSTGKFLFSDGYEQINVFSIDASTGALTPVAGSPFATTGSNFITLAVHPSGKFLFGSEDGYLHIHSYSIDPQTGALQEVAGSPIFTVNVDPWGMILEPNGFFAFTSNMSRGTVSTLHVDPMTGTLTWLGEVNAGTFPGGMAMDVAGKFLYVTNYHSDNVSVYAIDSSAGTLTEISGSPFAAGAFPISLAVMD